MAFCFVQNFFFGQHESSNIYFFCRTKREIFFPEFNIRFKSPLHQQATLALSLSIEENQNVNIFQLEASKPPLGE
jgi:hypothetical protein